jgi:protocatechuate 3,4-dioxygenase beta subunit
MSKNPKFRLPKACFKDYITPIMLFLFTSVSGLNSINSFYFIIPVNGIRRSIMKLHTWLQRSHLSTKLFSLLAVLAIAGCASAPAVSTQAPSLSSVPAKAAAPATLTAPTAQPSDTQAASPTTSATAAQSAATQPAAAAPSCTAPAKLTMAVTEGPFFKAGSPERSSLLDAGVTGTQLTLTGYVLTADCKPVANALLDFWQANAQGQYDNAGYTLRGHQFTDATGRYHLDTIVPGLYPGRTEHIHVKVQAPNGPLLTTQLFFPGSVDNQADQFYNPALLIQMQASGNRMQAIFDFVVSAR